MHAARARWARRKLVVDLIIQALGARCHRIACARGRRTWRALTRGAPMYHFMYEHLYNSGPKYQHQHMSLREMRESNEKYAFQGTEWQKTHGWDENGHARTTPRTDPKIEDAVKPPPDTSPPPAGKSTNKPSSSKPSNATPRPASKDVIARLKRKLDDAYDQVLILGEQKDELRAQTITAKRDAEKMRSSLKRANAALRRAKYNPARHALDQARSSIKKLMLLVHPDKRRNGRTIDGDLVSQRITDILEVMDVPDA